MHVNALHEMCLHSWNRVLHQTWCRLITVWWRMVSTSYLVEIISQSELLEIARSRWRGSDGLPELVLAAPQVVRAYAREQVIVPEHVSLQRGAPVHNGAHRCHLQVKTWYQISPTTLMSRTTQHISTATPKETSRVSLSEPHWMKEDEGSLEHNTKEEENLSSHLGAFGISCRLHQYVRAHFLSVQEKIMLFSGISKTKFMCTGTINRSCILLFFRRFTQLISLNMR